MVFKEDHKASEMTAVTNRGSHHMPYVINPQKIIIPADSPCLLHGSSLTQFMGNFDVFFLINMLNK